MSLAVGPRAPRIYNLFPLLVGSIDDWIRHVPRIAAMHFNWIYVNPFHFPGFSGSLYAVKDYYRLNPPFRGSSYENDESLIRDFVESAGARGVDVMMDLVINHTSKDSVLTGERPEWFMRDAEGQLVSPFAVDPDDPDNVTTWGDLAEIDFTLRPERDSMIEYWCNLVRYYVRLGIRGFRCDAAYKVPADVWRPVIQAAHEENPDVLFFAETLGCRLDEVEALRPARFDYFFNSSKWWDFKGDWLLEQYEQFRRIAPSVSFPESHDTPRLVNDLESSGVDQPGDIEAAYKRQYLFAATFSAAVMTPIGYEFGFSRNLNVVETRPADWEEPRFDLTDFIRECNAMKATLAPLNKEGPQHRMDSPTGIFGLLRRNEDGPEWVLMLVNPPGNGAWSLETDGSDPLGAKAVLGEEVTPGSGRRGLDQTGGIALQPGEIRVFAGNGRAE
jgi:starch synthase (maltosyl-transferring)